MVILHNAIKAIKNGVFAFFLEQEPVSSQTIQKLIKKTKKQVCWVFLNPDYPSILFCDFPLITRSATSHITIILIGCAPHT